MIIIEELVGIAFVFVLLGLFGVTIYQKAWGGLSVLVGIGALVFIYLFPARMNYIFFRGIWLNLQYIALAVIVAGFCYIAYQYFEKREWVRAAVWFSLGIVISIIIVIAYPTYRLSLIAHKYQPEILDNPIELNSYSLIHTPKDVAHTEMTATSTASLYTPKKEYMDVTIDNNNQFDYVAPINPDGFFNKFGVGAGYVIVHDHDEGENRKEIVDTPVHIGEGLFWTRGINHQLYKWTGASVYTSIIPIPIVENNQTRVALIADRISYSWLFHVPHWDGLKIIDKDKVQFLTPAQAQADPRLIGRPLFPKSLVDEILNAQTFEKGWTGNIGGRRDIIQFNTYIDDSHVQLIQLADGPYFMAPVVAKGGKSLIAIYYINARTANFFKYNMPNNKTHFGFERASFASRSASSVKPWNEQQYDIQNLQMFPKNGHFYWLSTITQSVTDPVDPKNDIHIYLETIVNDAADENTKFRFTSRNQVFQWADSGTILPGETSTTDLFTQLADLQAKEDELIQQIQALNL